MKIGIIGAGFTGLSAAYYLSKGGFKVTVFEKDSKPGGLALGYKEKDWDWTLEEHYHHWFTNDKSILNLANEINHKVIIKRPKTSSFVDNNIYQLDSPTSLLKFPKLNLIERIRMGFSLALLRYNPFWQPLEKYKAQSFLIKVMGKKGYGLLWQPLMVNKLGKYADKVSLAWFWARVYKRTTKLAYPSGGFLNFALHLQNEIEKKGGKFLFNTEVLELTNHDKTLIAYKTSNSKNKEEFDIVIVTVPSFYFVKIAPQLPAAYVKNLNKLAGIGAANLVLRMSDKFFKDNTYWLSMCDTKSPILAIVEHTNFMDKKHYKNEHLLYIGNYMETSDPKFNMTKNDLLKIYDPWLRKINPKYNESIIGSELFKANFAQPIIFTNYSKDIPTTKTPLKNVFLSNMQQVYPWDRGTNYAVELGKKVADLVMHERE